MNERLPQHEPNKSPDDFPALSSGMKSLFAARMAPSAAADEAVRAEIHRHFARAAGRSRISWRTLPWAVAAVILISALSWMIWPGYQPNNQTLLLAYQPGDVDRNGRIDILDAMSLAGILEGGLPIQSGFDLNGDGLFDQRDVDFVAMQAVRLNVEAERKEAKS